MSAEGKKSCKGKVKCEGCCQGISAKQWKDLKEQSRILGYPATQVVCGWARAVIEQVFSNVWAGALVLKPHR